MIKTVMKQMAPAERDAPQSDCALFVRLRTTGLRFPTPAIGQTEHVDARVIVTLKQAGVTMSPSAIAGFNQPGSDPFHLRRIIVGFMGLPFPFARNEEG